MSKGSTLVAESSNGRLWFGHTDDTMDPVWLDGRQLPRGWHVYSRPFEPPGEHVAGNINFVVTNGREPTFRSELLEISYYAPRRHRSGGSYEGLIVHYRTVFAIWLAIAAAWAARFFLRVRRVNSRRRAGHCPACGYDLRGTPGRCPECGWEAPVAGAAGAAGAAGGG